MSIGRERAQVVVTVKDYGMGISPEALRRLFERGYRAREAVATAPGLGLGLNISAEIVRRHGGAIDVRAGHPRGSVVTIRLPLVEECQNATGNAGEHVVDVA